MTIKKAKLSAKSLSNTTASKPSTVTRAAITAEIKPTRGKQLVEHNPFSLIPDPDNPRPGEQIDDSWLVKYLYLGTVNSLCKYDASGEYIIPAFKDLNRELPANLEDDYEFLRSLAYSIRNDGLIEPIEIFLADRNNDPEYFVDLELDYGYVVLEGHQRRLAGIMAGVNLLTCIEITDESMLAKLKVKHRKLRRQLSENNLRKGLTVGQNYILVRELLQSDDSKTITLKELSSIIGLNEEIAGSLRKLAVSRESFPNQMLNLIENNQVSFKWIRTWISKPRNQIEIEVDRLLAGEKPSLLPIAKSSIKARGRSGGAIKRSAIFKVNQERDSRLLQDYLMKFIPGLNTTYLDDSPFHSLEKTLNRLLDLAKSC